MAPHGCYPCKATQDEDEWIALAVANEAQWQALCNLMEDPAWARLEKFSDELSRWHNQAELDIHLGHWTRDFGAYQLAEKLQKAGIAATPSYSTKQLTHDSHMAERDFFVRTDHPVLGKVLLTGLPVRFSDSPRPNYGTPPLLGQDNDYVFGKLLGLPKEEIKRLTEEKILY
jgi:crotonobetainyl-CoA:carnitine CoA-transferase CaiB-like acyl-CoA transferase